MKNDFEQSEFNNFIVPFYFIPFISSLSIKAIITGETVLGPYQVLATGIQARLIGSAFIIMVIYDLYHVFIKIPKKNGGIKVMKAIIREFFSSVFLYIWLSVIIITLMIQFSGIFNIIYFIIIIICFISQIYYIKNYTKIIKNILK
ncbi:MAG TPA: hypothetical protein PLM53_21170 [Spirochaetota bacterium]|nr:hypothetical protein [Spirochaetota bacterium]HQF10602.1 hypothetical protein [Spirochaetota bacterium]HQH99608.1 hypothetical protein [Spirochaetota bacterium]HQJ73144.1 hypothetical protein [Spirochaetota bacterium]